MKKGIMMIFFLIAFIVYFLVNWYVFSRGMKALDATGYKTAFIFSYWILVLSFIVGQFLERGNPGGIARVVSFVGSYWLALFLYLLIGVLIVDLIRIIQHFTHIIPLSLSSGILSGKMLFLYVFGIAFLISLGGYYNAKHPRIKKVDIALAKKDSKLEHLKVVVATDVHLGVLLQDRTANRLVRDINSQHPDIVLFGGDLVDHNPVPVVKKDLGKYFDEIKASMGVYAITGNHEYIGNADVSADYFSKHGVHYLRDTVQILDDKIQLIGRDDSAKKGYTGLRRKTVKEIMEDARPDLPVILIDHQPVDYESVVAGNVDLMISGHTHRGQLWPFGYITKVMFENDYGLYKKGETYFYTSNGYGTWAPPVRTGNRPELVVFNIHLQD